MERRHLAPNTMLHHPDRHGDLTSQMAYHSLIIEIFKMAIAQEDHRPI